MMEEGSSVMEKKSNYGSSRIKPRVDYENDLPENHPVKIKFQKYAKELELQHDRYERLVKLSRDVTVESKRIIFQLQRCHARGCRKNKNILDDASSRLDCLRETMMKKIAHELKDQDAHQYLRAVSPGLQEYTEAVCFYSYLSQIDLPTTHDLQMALTYAAVEESNDGMSVLLTVNDLLLGLGDVGGEVMRFGINSVGRGDYQQCYDARVFLGMLLEGYNSCGRFVSVVKELQRKINVLRQSLKKVEQACCNIKVRESEVPVGSELFFSNLDDPGNFYDVAVSEKSSYITE